MACRSKNTKQEIRRVFEFSKEAGREIFVTRRVLDPAILVMTNIAPATPSLPADFVEVPGIDARPSDSTSWPGASLKNKYVPLRLD